MLTYKFPFDFAEVKIIFAHFFRDTVVCWRPCWMRRPKRARVNKNLGLCKGALYENVVGEALISSEKYSDISHGIKLTVGGICSA